MRKVVIRCAAAGIGKGSNLGMNTVDYAIYNIIQNNEVLRDKVILSRPWPSYIKDSNGNYPEYQLRDDFPMEFWYDYMDKTQEHEKSGLVFWGDFQHGYDYHIQASKRLKHVSSLIGISKTQAECGDITRDYFLLRDHFQKRKLPYPVLMYGGTFFQNSLKDYFDDEYFSNLKWLYKNASFAKVRDPYSASIVNQITGNYEKNYLGVDAALLNTKEELLSLPQLNSPQLNIFEESIGVYFGRSTKGFPKKHALQLISEFSKEMATKIVNIPWAYFSSGLFSYSLDRKKGIFINRSPIKSINDEFTPGDILKGMSKLKLIITDTYHVALNGIALGIPVICIYEPFPSDTRNANMGYIESWRDKRTLFFLTNNLSDFLISSYSLKDKEFRSRKIKHIMNILEEPDQWKIAIQGIYEMAHKHRNEITHQLMKL